MPASPLPNETSTYIDELYLAARAVIYTPAGYEWIAVNKAAIELLQNVASAENQPVPTPPLSPCPIASLVAQDILRRAEFGFQKYGVTLARTDLSRRQWLQHAYEEALDIANYLKVLIEAEPPAGPALHSIRDPV